MYLARNALFSTRSFAVATGQRMDSASRWLGGLARRDALVRVTRGVWAQLEHPAFTPYAATGLLIGNEHGYVSFVSALHRRGVLSQIPGGIQVATTGHGRTLDSPIGRFEFLQLRPPMMTDGIEMSETEPPYAIATAEKALLDTFYIGTRRGNRYQRLPELDLSDIDHRVLAELLERQVTARPIRQAIATRLAGLAQASATRP
ncbi:MAG: hypothetical protein OXG82_20525 [Gammaproteobacteria bacterium]|nr:hypothetical protein [Gammaproteobacteria bacterium]